MNLILRFKNKATLVALLGAVFTFIYQIFGLLGVVPAVSQDMIIQLVGLVINILVALGIVVDPTTAGVGDSVQVMDYKEPRKENEGEIK